MSTEKLGSFSLLQLSFIATLSVFFLGLPALASDDIKITTLNAQNLYDHTHDRGYFDYTFLPVSHNAKKKKCSTLRSPYYKNLCLNLNWTNRAVNQRLNQFKKALKSFGKKPDILAVQEIENESILHRLSEKLGYADYVVTNQKSKRGIDVGLLWNKDKLVYIKTWEIEAPLRSPLKVHFKIKKTNEDLFVYINHWPSQSAPTVWREEAATKIKTDILKIYKDSPESLVVVLGDFNVVESEEKEVFKGFSLGQRAPLIDLHNYVQNQNPSLDEKLPAGTYFNWSLKQWCRFDRIFIGKNFLTSPTQVLQGSYEIQISNINSIYKPDLSKETPIPLGYDFLGNYENSGLSDHFPVSVTFRSK